MLTAFNILILGCLFFFLIIEELRYRRFSQSVREKQKRLVTMAHQLRSPLTILRKYNAAMRNQDFGHISVAQFEVLAKMEVATSEVVITLNRLLFAARVEKGEISTEPKALNLVACIDGALDCVVGLAKEREHTIRFTHPKRDFFVHADSLLIHGILDEILLNAIVYTPRKGTITISLKEKKHSVVVLVKDTGIGITKAEQPHIFHKFFRGKTASTMYNGNGMGLHFAKQFIEALGGKIRYSSNAKKGSTFSVELLRANDK